MKEKILNRLISVKSIMTLILTIVFSYLAIKGVINAESFMLVFTTITSFYFGTVAEKGGK